MVSTFEICKNAPKSLTVSVLYLLLSLKGTLSKTGRHRGVHDATSVLTGTGSSEHFFFSDNTEQELLVGVFPLDNMEADETGQKADDLGTGKTGAANQ